MQKVICNIEIVVWFIESSLDFWEMPKGHPNQHQQNNQNPAQGQAQHDDGNDAQGQQDNQADPTADCGERYLSWAGAEAWRGKGPGQSVEDRLGRFGADSGG